MSVGKTSITLVTFDLKIVISSKLELLCNPIVGGSLDLNNSNAVSNSFWINFSKKGLKFNIPFHKNPIKSVEKLVVEIERNPTNEFFISLKKLLDYKKLTLNFLNPNICKLYPMNPITPTWYSLSKIHKPNWKKNLFFLTLIG